MSAATTASGRIRLSRELVARLSAALEKTKQQQVRSFEREDEDDDDDDNNNNNNNDGDEDEDEDASSSLSFFSKKEEEQFVVSQQRKKKLEFVCENYLLAGIENCYSYSCYLNNGNIENLNSGTCKSFLQQNFKNKYEKEEEEEEEEKKETTTSVVFYQEPSISRRKPLNCAQSTLPEIDEAKEAKNANEKQHKQQQLTESKAQIMSLTSKQLSSLASSCISGKKNKKGKQNEKPRVEVVGGDDVKGEKRSNNVVAATFSLHCETSNSSHAFHVSSSSSDSTSTSTLTSTFTSTFKRTLHPLNNEINLNSQIAHKEAGSSLVILKEAKGKRSEKRRRIREENHHHPSIAHHLKKHQYPSVILGAHKLTEKGETCEKKLAQNINSRIEINSRKKQEVRKKEANCSRSRSSSNSGSSSSSSSSSSSIKTANEKCELTIKRSKTVALNSCKCEAVGERRRRRKRSDTCKWCRIADCDSRKKERKCLLPAASCWPQWLALLALALALLLPASLAQLFPAEAQQQQQQQQQQSSQQDEQLSRAVFATMLTHSNGATGIGNTNNIDAQLATKNLTKNEQSMLMIKGGNFTQQQENSNSEETGLSSSSQILIDEEKTFFDRLLEFGRIFLMGAIIVADICGNSLVILSVCRHSKLRVTTNWFVVSLACADILVALFAMTFNASLIISGRWLFQRWVCDFWNACDVLASTASILHLCCISIDRYIAIMRPLDYPMKITTRRVVYALCAVWISSALLSYIPIFTGVYTTAEHIKWLKEHPDQCEFVVNRVYALVSSSISFWIPCCIMVFTYYRIYREATRQEKFIYKAQTMIPAPNFNHHHHHTNHNTSNHCSSNRSKQRRSKSVAVSSSSANNNNNNNNNNNTKQQLARNQHKLDNVKPPPTITTTATTATTSSQLVLTTNLNSAESIPAISSSQQPIGSNLDATANNQQRAGSMLALAGSASTDQQQQQQQQTKLSEPTVELSAEEQDSNSGQSTPTKRSISKMKREHKAAKTLGIIMGVFILCWLPFFSWYTPQHICGHACDGIVPHSAVTILFWIGYFNSTLNPIIYAYFNHEFRDAFKKTLQWIFCCCNDLKCLRVNRPNDNQHYNCTYRSTQEIGLVSNS